MAKFFIMDFATNSIGNLLFFPVEIVLTRICVDCGNVPRYSGSLDCLVQLIKEEGMAGFYKGILFKLAYTTLQTLYNTVVYFKIFRMDPYIELEGSLLEFSLSFAKLFLLYPIEVAMRRKIVSPVGSIHCDLASWRSIWENLYRGVIIEILPKTVTFLYWGVFTKNALGLIDIFNL